MKKVQIQVVTQVLPKTERFTIQTLEAFNILTITDKGITTSIDITTESNRPLHSTSIERILKYAEATTNIHDIIKTIPHLI
jgi:hypothetical protein